MKFKNDLFLFSIIVFLFGPNLFSQTKVEIHGEKFFINGKPTYEGKMWNNYSIEGLLFNSRMVQGIFDDSNPETRSLWKYPDTQIWDPNRNTDEFVAAMPNWYKNGLIAFTINLQGGSPTGYGNKGWKNSAFNENGKLKVDYFNRLEEILNKADQLGMVVILGLFYFGQDESLTDETAIICAVDNTIEWLFKSTHQNILIEVNNECDVKSYDHKILMPDRIHELILRIKNKSNNNFRFPVSTSFKGKSIPSQNVVSASDFILLHGNGVTESDFITEMVKKTRMVPGYKPMPIIFNEDDHYDFEKPDNNLIKALQSFASWGFFDFRSKDETDIHEGFQSIPVDWSINSKRKKEFFTLLKQITGGN